MSPYQDTIRQLSAIYAQGEAKALARMLFEDRFGFTVTDILLGKDNDLSANEREELQNIVSRMLKNEPIQYILGHTEFCGLNLHVAPGVLIPRPETAELVEWIKSENTKESSVLDVGTGSGCIALALAKNGFTVEGWDISEEALTIARRNAEQLDIDVRFIKEDVLHLSKDSGRKTFDIIVSNPPYICLKEAEEMEHNVLDYEPHTALFVPDNDPLLFYRAIAEYATTHLAPNGQLFFEINRAFSKETARMLQGKGFGNIEIRQDQYGNDRMIKALLA